MWRAPHAWSGQLEGGQDQDERQELRLLKIHCLEKVTNLKLLDAFYRLLVLPSDVSFLQRRSEGCRRTPQPRPSLQQIMSCNEADLTGKCGCEQCSGTLNTRRIAFINGYTILSGNHSFIISSQVVVLRSSMSILPVKYASRSK